MGSLAPEKVPGWVLRNSPSLDWGGLEVPTVAGATGSATYVEGFVVLPTLAGSYWR
jgi:hypothetical protein